MEGVLAVIWMFGGNFAPRNWAFCNGQLLAISQNSALFSLLGTTYGGDGRTTFGLPEMRGRVPMHSGSGPGLTPRTIGQRSGQEQVTLNQTQIPSHTHPATTTTQTQVAVAAGNGGEGIANGQFLANHPGAYSEDSTTGAMLAGTTSASTTTVLNAGGSLAHNNLQPFMVVNFVICLSGIYPSRN
ncbi:MAG: phage tail protein [Flavobacteriaceae bacterium]|nr:phage tail protein [Flavobacteriaceae bacterium]